MTITFFIAILFLSCKEKSTSNDQKIAQEFTFKQGVGVNHWASYPIKGWSYADSRWFNKTDVEWVSEQKFDHIQLYVSGEEISNPDYSLNKERIAVLDSVISWNKKEKLGTIITLSRFPEFKIDTLLSKETKDSLTLQKQVAFWGKLSEYFSKKGLETRFNIHGNVNSLTEDINYLNQYNLKVLEEIRKSNPVRKVYLPIYTFEKMKEMVIPNNDKNINISCDLIDDSAVVVFTMQHAFPENFPTIKFPGTIPDLTSILKEGHSDAKHSNIVLNESYLDKDFEKVLLWMATNAKNIELYIPSWRYYTGWPFIPESVEDEESIISFGESFSKSTKKYNINWAVYDYNSGSPMRYTNNPGSPANSNGEISIVLQGLNLKRE